MELQEKQLFRSCTTVNEIQKLLLKHLKENNVRQLRYLLEEGNVDVNHIYTDSDKNALQIACIDFPHNIECLELLLDQNIDLTYEEPDTEKMALHFAAESGNVQIFTLILNKMNEIGYNFNNSNILFSLIKFIHYIHKNEIDYLTIFRMLLTETDVDVNVPETESGWTVLYMAAKFEFEQLVKMLIETKFDTIDLDVKIGKNKTARDLIVEKNLYSGPLPDIRDETRNKTEILRKNLRELKTQEFLTNFTNFEDEITEKLKYELLSLSVDKNLYECVEFLINKGTNPFPVQTGTKLNLFQLASKRGYYNILKMLLKTEPESEVITQSLIELNKSNQFSESEHVNHDSCLKILLANKQLRINAVDENRNTALHYAVRYQSSDTALELLRSGASLACKDSFEHLPIEDLDLKTLTTHLNECVQYEHKDTVPISDKNACLRIDVTTLLPPRNQTVCDSSQNCKLEMEQLVLKREPEGLLTPETEVLQYISQSQELRPLLKHPVILTFLFLKCHQIRAFFYINLVLYLIFLFSLLTYIIIEVNTKQESNQEFLSGLSYALLSITFVLLIIREVGQLIIFRFKYLISCENWIEIVLLITTCGILITQTDAMLIRQFSALAIVAAAFELLLMIGQLPAMSTNIMMLRTVSYTFFKLLLWYSILLFAFAYSFYTLFQEQGTDNEDPDFFTNPGMSLLKTIVMLTGEFDASSIKFNSFPIVSHLIFIMFVFVIAIVLFNLLNGLAVSDTQMIKNDAELYGQILHVERVAYVEKILLSNRIVDWIPMVKQICLFPMNVSETSIAVYPNQNYRIVLKNDDENVDEELSCYKKVFNISLDKKIQRSIRKLLYERKEESETVTKERLLRENAELRKELNLLKINNYNIN